MPIDVTCTGCKTRFQVSEKFAGKKGPCPKCKTVITIPTLKEQVRIEEPDAVGPKGTTGQPVFRPIARTETRLSQNAAIAIGGAVVVVILGALVMRFAGSKPISPLITGLGAVVLAPALAMAGYAFLREDELEPYRGPQLWARIAGCSAVYALLWGAYWAVFAYLDVQPLDNLTYLVVVIPIVIAFGSVAAMTAFDLDFGPAAMHYCVYLIATILLRMLMDMSPIWEAAPKTPLAP